MNLIDEIKYLLDEFHLGDKVYDVRERADMTDFEGDSWQHPDVLRFSQCVQKLRDLVDAMEGKSFSEEALERIKDAVENHRDLNYYRDWCHSASSDAGWWDDLEEALTELRDAPPRVRQRVMAWYLSTKIALVHSESSEMLEGLRKGLHDDHLPHREMEEVECIDILIRVFDYAGRRGFDLEAALTEKMEYNGQRADHKKEAREAEGGKQF